MPTTPLLAIDELTTSQTGKEVTINNAIIALEGAMNATLPVAMAAGNVTLTVNQFTRNFIFTCSGQTADRILNVPALVNAVATKRVFSVINASPTFGLTVQVTGGAGATIYIPKGNKARLLAVDGLGNILLVANTPEVYRFGGFATSSILSDEILLDHVVTDAFTLFGNMLGSKASVGVNPGATWVGILQKNGAAVGNVSISTSGVATLTTTAGAEVNFVSGDTVTFLAPTVVDASIARLRFTFRGYIS